MKKQKQKAFTLLELLVVMAIIGVLSSVILVTTMRGLEQSRDARRIQEVYEIARALQVYHSQFNKYPDNTDTGDVGCWLNWDAGNAVNGENDTFIKPLVDEGILEDVPREWTDLKDGWGSQCTYRYMKAVDPCDGKCKGTYAILYAACETDDCPVNERPSCCDGSSWQEGTGDNDPKDITIFLKE